MEALINGGGNLLLSIYVTLFHRMHNNFPSNLRASEALFGSTRAHTSWRYYVRHGESYISVHHALFELSKTLEGGVEVN